MNTETTTGEIITTETHRYVIAPAWNRPDVYIADYQPLNPKTGKPWQRPHHLGCQWGDVTYDSDLNKNRPWYFSTVELARAAVQKQIEIFSKRKR